MCSDKCAGQQGAGSENQAGRRASAQQVASSGSMGSHVLQCLGVVQAAANVVTLDAPLRREGACGSNRRQQSLHYHPTSSGPQPRRVAASRPQAPRQLAQAVAS